MEYKDLIEKDIENKKLNESMNKIIKARFIDSRSSLDLTPKSTTRDQILPEP